MTQTEVYAPKSVQLWKTVVDWLSFVVQILMQIVRSTTSVAQIFNFIGFSQGCFLSPSSPAFKPLPVVDVPLESAVDIAGRHAGEADAVSAAAAGGDGSRFAKLTVVLDLDETLVCAYETSSLPPSLCTQATEAGLKWFELECVSSDKECDGKPKISYVTVFERPGLHDFLKQLSKFADLVLFTAGLEGYARPLVDKIDVDNLFCRRLYRPSTISTVVLLSCFIIGFQRYLLVEIGV